LTENLTEKAMIGVAVLGCGRIGRVHARNVTRHRRARLVTLFDTLADVAQQTAAELGVRGAGSLDEILSDRAVAAVIVATPTDTHVPLVTAAVRAGKAVLCEKPIDLDLERARACWRDIAGHDPRVMIGFNRRFDPSFSALHERLRSGEIGKLELAVITSRDPAPPPAGYLKSSGGLMRDMTIHDFDMARFLAGEVVGLHAFAANLVDPDIGRLGDVDTAAMTLRARSGALVQITNSRRCAYGYDQRIEAFGPGGMLQAGNQYPTSVESWTAAHTGARNRVLDFFIERYARAYEAELDAFITCVEAGRAMSPDFSDGLEALRLAAAAEQSFRSSQVVDLG
jgi:myo-inositol 2-dehydrogenase/D-chiro-inositol 1-dehydrogenase